MNKLSLFILIGLAVVLFACSACAPYFLSDEGNSFLKNFVNQEMLSLIAVMATIVLASCGNLHLELNRLESELGCVIFKKSRKSIIISAYTMIVVFGLTFVLVIVKSSLRGLHESAFVNSVAITFIAVSISVLVDIGTSMFAIPSGPSLKNDGQDDS